MSNRGSRHGLKNLKAMVGPWTLSLQSLLGHRFLLEHNSKTLTRNSAISELSATIINYSDGFILELIAPSNIIIIHHKPDVD